MTIRSLALLALLALACVLPTSGEAQAQPGYQYGPNQPYVYRPDQEEREREREWRREERRRARQQQEWYDEQWRWRNQRYFGGYVLQPRPGESFESYARRVRVECNNQWNRCATYCNTIRDPRHRAACVANCNNDLYECKSGF